MMPVETKPYDLIIRYHAALVSIKVYTMLKPEQLHFCMEAERCTFFGPLPLVYIPTVADCRRKSYTSGSNFMRVTRLGDTQ